MSAYEILNSFESFCNSDVLTFDELMLPYSEYAKIIYQKMRDKELQATHSFYLKEFHLNLAYGKLRLNYDLVLLDEAQDTNPVTFAIFNLLKADKKIAVGDRHQQIYAFRGAVNALRNFKGESFYLTNSFRFNEKIAKNATYFLNVWKGENKEVKGLNKDNKINTKAIISRTNSYLIETVVSLLKDDEKFKFVREPYNVFGLALNLLRLKNKEQLDKSFKYLEKLNYDELLDMSENEDFNDYEMKTALNIVEKYNKALIGYYVKAKEFFNDSNLKPKYYLTTAHTSKGLEWDEVTLLEDFNLLYLKVAKLMKERNVKEEPYYFIKALSNNAYQGLADLENEVNLFYVAYTRGKVKAINKSDVSFIKNKVNTEISYLIK
jgi:ATP-dependent exoDNAse (exonuclease V) beta subunit